MPPNKQRPGRGRPRKKVATPRAPADPSLRDFWEERREIDARRAAESDRRALREAAACGAPTPGEITRRAAAEMAKRPRAVYVRVERAEWLGRIGDLDRWSLVLLASADPPMDVAEVRMAVRLGMARINAYREECARRGVPFDISQIAREV